MAERADKHPDRPVYLLTGSDRPKVARALARLRAHFLPEAVERASALEVSGAQAVALCNAGGLLGDRRLVVVEEVDGRRGSDGRRKGGWKAVDVEAIVAYLANPAPGTVLALVGEEIGASSALAKACARAGRVLEYSVDTRHLVRWVAEQFRLRGVEAEPDACAALVHVVGEDVHALATEVDKLVTWSQGEPIGEREALELAAPTREDRAYVLTDAVGMREGAHALALSETMLEREAHPRRDVAARLAWALSGHMLRLSALKRLAARGVEAKEAAAALSLHPYRTRRLLEQAEGFSEQELEEAIVRLAALDGALKGQSTLEADLELQRAIADLVARPTSRSR
ncbi:MAG: DNA polymerase III subunit delta [Thermoleophilia bacterium]|nr:DNA polymerase III subunit delta [Thermoleophilia bacterium]